MAKRSNWKKIILIVIACAVAYVFLLPLMFMVFSSFKGLSEGMTSTKLLPKVWTLENYKALISNTETAPLLLWLRNTVIVTVAGTLLRITTSVLAGYSLARLPVPGKRFFVISIIWAMAIPEIVTFFPLFYVFKEVGRLNTFWPLILPSGSGVMCIYLIYNFLLSFPVELEEAGYMEGAGVLTILRKIVVPSIRPVIITQAFITFLGLYNSFLWPSLVINRNEMRTVTLGLAALVLGENYTNPGLMMASTTVSVIPVLIIFLFANRYIVRGFTQSGIK